MAGIKHNFHQYYGLTGGEFSTDQETRLRQMLDVPTLCKLCGNTIDKFATTASGKPSMMDQFRWAEEERTEMHVSCIQKRQQER